MNLLRNFNTEGETNLLGKKGFKLTLFFAFDLIQKFTKFQIILIKLMSFISNCDCYRGATCITIFRFLSRVIENGL